VVSDPHHSPVQVESARVKARDKVRSTSGGTTFQKRLGDDETGRPQREQEGPLAASGDPSAQKAQGRPQQVEGARLRVRDSVPGISEGQPRGEELQSHSSRGHRHRSRSHRRRRRELAVEGTDAKAVVFEQSGDKRMSSAAEEMMARCMQFALEKQQERKSGQAGESSSMLTALGSSGRNVPPPPSPTTPLPPESPAPLPVHAIAPSSPPPQQVPHSPLQVSNEKVDMFQQDPGRRRSAGTRRDESQKDMGRLRSPGARRELPQKDSGRQRSPAKQPISKKRDDGSARARWRTEGESMVKEARSLMKDELFRRAYTKYCEGVQLLMQALPEKDEDADAAHLRSIDIYLREMENLKVRIKGSPNGR